MKPNKNLLGKFAVIRYYTGSNPDFSILPPASFVRFSKADPEKFYWRGGSWCVIDENTELVEVLKKQPKTHMEEDDVYVKFLKKYHMVFPNKELVQSDGWIAPNGDFYTCGNGGHWGLGSLLSACVYNADESWNWLAEEKGWLYLHKDGVSSYERDKMPKGMFDKLDKLSEIGDDRWKRKLYYLCMRYEESIE